MSAVTIGITRAEPSLSVTWTEMYAQGCCNEQSMPAVRSESYEGSAVSGQGK